MISIKKLALLSYKKNKLDSTRVNKIVRHLKRSELKEYIKCLKSIERQKCVTIVLSSKSNKANEAMFKKIYPDKRINFVYDPSLIAGFKILDNDFVYEYNLKDTIDKISKFIVQ